MMRLHPLHRAFILGSLIAACGGQIAPDGDEPTVTGHDAGSPPSADAGEPPKMPAPPPPKPSKPAEPECPPDECYAPYPDDWQKLETHCPMEGVALCSPSDTAAITGTVHTKLGEPVENATVWTNQGLSAGYYCYVETKTDAAGHFTLLIPGVARPSHGFGEGAIVYVQKDGRRVDFWTIQEACDLMSEGTIVLK